MNSTTSTDSKKEISLLDSLNQSWLKLPLAVMRDVGPATQTLGAIVRLTTTELYCSVSKISDMSRLPVATTRKHLVTLNDGGWILNVGREHTRAGRARRTCTIKLTAKTKSTLNDYSILPWWASCSITKVGRLPWSAKAVLSVVMSRLAAIKVAVTKQGWEGDDATDENFWGFLENMGGDDRFRFSLENLQRQTGLWSQAVVTAKRRLKKLGIVDWVRSTRDDGGDDQDIIFPNAAFRVVVTPTTDDLVSLTFKVVG